MKTGISQMVALTFGIAWFVMYVIIGEPQLMIVSQLWLACSLILGKEQK